VPSKVIRVSKVAQASERALDAAASIGASVHNFTAMASISNFCFSNHVSPIVNSYRQIMS
jgi:hypothetical protein